MSNIIRHPYHLVEESPWPLLSALSVFFLTTGLLKWFCNNSLTLLLMALLTLMIIMFQWWRDISKESSAQGLHTKLVELGLRWGMLLFIVSEVFFFLSFFWAFFHSSLAPSIEIKGIWPPVGILPFNSFSVPLLNTIVLLSSGVSVTWAHHALMMGNFISAKKGLIVTVILGVYFTLLQAMEYYEASFSMADSSYGSSFFIATGFHGLHVMVGTTFLFVCLFRHSSYHFSHSHHFGFEAAAWYWHFVDVVWLFLFIWVYWWGGG